MFLRLLKFCSIYACPDLDDSLKLLKFEFGEHEKYLINPAGPLNRVRGQLFSTSNLLHNKRFCSHSIYLSSECNCKTMSGGSCQQILNSENDRPLDFHDRPQLNEGTASGSVQRNYEYSYNACLTAMFASKTPRINIFADFKPSLSHALQIISRRKKADTENFLAILLLLPEDLWPSDLINCISEDSGSIYLKSKIPGSRFGFSLKSYKNSGGKTQDEILKSVINYFQDCGKNESYRKIIAEKEELCKEYSNDAIHILETPAFIIQSYIFEFTRSNYKKHAAIAASVFNLLQQMILMDNDKRPIPENAKAKEVFDKYFIKKPDDDTKTVDDSKAADDINAVDGDTEACIEYNEVINDIRCAYCKLPFLPFEAPLIHRLVPFYNRKLNRIMEDQAFNSLLESTIFTILCMLFYDYENNRFCLENSKLCESRCKNKLERLFCESIRTPDNIHNNIIDNIMVDLNIIFGDLPDKEIRYCYTTEFHNTESEERHYCRNKIAGELINILYIISFVSGRDDLKGELLKLKRIKQANPDMPDNKIVEIVTLEIGNIASDLFESLSYSKDLAMKISNVKCYFTKGDKPEIRFYGRVHMKYRHASKEALFVHITRNNVSRTYANLGLSYGCNKLYAFYNKIAAREPSLILNLLKKKILYDSEMVHWDNTLEDTALTARLAVQKIDSAFIKAKLSGNLDHLNSLNDILNMVDDLRNLVAGYCLFLDRLRALLEQTPACEPMKRIKVCNLMINAVLNGVRKVAYDENSSRMLFLMLYGIKEEPLKRFSDCIFMRCAAELIKNGGSSNVYYPNLADLEVHAPNFFRYLLMREYGDGNLGKEMANIINDGYVFGNSQGKGVVVFTHALFSAVLCPKSKELLDLLRTNYPTDLAMLAGLFSIFLLTERRGTGMLAEAYHVATMLIKAAQKREDTSSKDHLKLIVKNLFDFYRHADSWNRFLGYARSKNDAMWEFWSMCSYLLEKSFSNPLCVKYYRDEMRDYLAKNSWLY